MKYEWKTDDYSFEIHDGVFKLRPQNRKAMSKLGTFQRWIPIDTIAAVSIDRPERRNKFQFVVSDNFSKSSIDFLPKDDSVYQEILETIVDLQPTSANGVHSLRNWSLETEDELKNAASASGLSIADYVRQIIPPAAPDAGKNDREAARELRKSDKSSSDARFLNTYGKVVFREAFIGKSFVVYEKGFVAFGFIKPGLPERVLAINAQTETSKKTGVGRAAAAVLTSGANLALSSNIRGDVYLNVTTEKKTHSFHWGTPSPKDIQRMNKFVAVVQNILEQQQTHVAGAVSSRTSQETQLLAAPAIDNQDALSSELVKLSQLKDSGILSDEEFTAAKRKLLGL